MCKRLTGSRTAIKVKFLRTEPIELWLTDYRGPIYTSDDELVRQRATFWRASSETPARY